jgi:uncharacterized membrane protein YdfJ with MMPL/SSD domain
MALIRLVLVPAIMTLLGGASWYLPRWLERLLPTAQTAADHEPRPQEAALFP